MNQPAWPDCGLRFSTPSPSPPPLRGHFHHSHCYVIRQGTCIATRTYAFPPPLYYCQIIFIDLQLTSCTSKLLSIKNSFGLYTCEILINSPLLEHFKILYLNPPVVTGNRKITSHCKVTEYKITDGNCCTRARQCYFACALVHWLTLQPHRRLTPPDCCKKPETILLDLCASRELLLC